MISASFDYVAASSVDDAIRLLGEYGDRAKLLAGGHSLLPAMKLRLSSPEVLIDLGRVPGLASISRSGDGLTIGARCTHRQISESADVREVAPILAAAASVIGDPAVRTRGTIGGSLAHADPAADLPAVMLTLEATIVAAGPNGQRTIAAGDFFQGLFATALEPAEVIVEVHVPASPGGSYQKFENRASGYAIVGVAAVISEANGLCSSARIAITGAGSAPVRATAAEAALVGMPLDEATIAAAAALAPGAVDLLDDLHASADYRAALVEVYTGRAIRAARSA